MNIKSYTIVGSPENLQRLKDEYKLMGFYSFWRGADLVVSPWPKPKEPESKDDTGKRRVVKKRERNFGHARD